MSGKIKLQYKVIKNGINSSTNFIKNSISKSERRFSNNENN